MNTFFTYFSTPLLAIAMLVAVQGVPYPTSSGASNNQPCAETVKQTSPCDDLYSKLSQEVTLCKEAFENAYKGYTKIKNKKNSLLTLVDFSLPSNKERLFVIDMNKGKVLFKSLCAHGQGSGSLMATDFSNKNGSHKSSLGFYLTEGTYMGGNGYSLRLRGLEKGINDQALARAIVIHGAKYANPEVCPNGNRLGRSWGCPAVPEKMARPIIDTIKNGSVLFIYAQQPQYFAKSTFVNG